MKQQRVMPRRRIVHLAQLVVVGLNPSNFDRAIMSNAHRFLDEVDKQGLLEEHVLNELRNQVAQIKTRVTPETVAKLLVDNGHLTRYQATKLIGQLNSDPQDDPPPAASTDSSEEELGLAPQEDEELGLAPTEEELAAGADADDDDELELLDDAEDDVVDLDDGNDIEDDDVDILDEDELEPVEELEPIDEELEPIDDGLEPIDDTPLTGSPAGQSQFAAGTTATQPAAAKQQAEQIKRSLQPQKNVWDSKFLLVGGGVFLLLLFAGALLTFSLMYGNADEMFRLAEQDYRDQSYTNAINKYETFLRRFPNNPNASLARVRIGMARLRSAVEGSSDMENALTVARDVLPEIEQEEALPEARGDLAAVLPQMAEGLLRQADRVRQASEKERLLALVDETLDLIQNPVYIPGSLQQSQAPRIDRIREQRLRVQRDVNRSNDLLAALEEIQVAVDAGDTPKAYAVRAALVRTYPSLEDNTRLNEAVLKITERETELVEVQEQLREPSRDESPEQPDFQVVLASHRGQAVDALQGRVIAVTAAGAAYGIDAGNGRVLWRRYIGSDRTIPPKPITSQPESDILLADTRANELVRVRGPTGEVVWRLPMEELFHEPQIDDHHIFVTTDSGKVLQVDSETGSSSRLAQLPQGAMVPIGHDDRRTYVYQLGRHSNLYVLEKDGLQCPEVFYVGHKEGTIAVPPVMALGYLLVAENAGPNYSLLHVLATDSSGRNVERAMEPIRLRGHVHIQPWRTGRRVVVVTDTAATYVFDVEPTASENPVTEILRRVPRAFERNLVYPSTDGGRLMLAGLSLALYEMQVNVGRLSNEWIEYTGDTFLAPAMFFDDVAIHVRRPRGATGVSVTAINVQNRSTLWETALAVPGARIVVDPESREIQAISTRGALYEITGDALRNGVAEPAYTASSTTPDAALVHSAALEDGTCVLVDPEKPGQVAVYDPQRSGRALRLASTGIRGDRLTTAPVAFHDGVLLPLSAGRIVHWDPKTGQFGIQPFQPPLQPEQTIQWQRPAVLDNGREFVVADNRQTLYRVGVGDNDPPHLQALSETDLVANAAAPLAAVSNLVYAVLRTDRGDILASFSLPDLELQDEWHLDGQVVWGPEVVDDMVLLMTDSEGLLCMSDDGQRRWTLSDLRGVPVGQPLSVGNDMVFASLAGDVWRIETASGVETGHVSVGQPLASGPVAYGTRLLFSARDGTLLVIAMPGGDSAVSAK